MLEFFKQLQHASGSIIAMYVTHNSSLGPPQNSGCDVSHVSVVPLSTDSMVRPDGAIKLMLI